MYSSLELITGPTEAIITTEEFSTFAKLDDTPDIDVISSATALAEQFCNRRFLAQTWRINYSYQPEVVNLPYGYINSVTSVKQIDENLDETTETQGLIYLAKTGENGYIKVRQGQTWTTLTDFLTMQVDYVVGYDNINSMPEPKKSNLKTALLNIASVLYDNRNVQIKLNERPDLTALLQPFKIYTFS